MSDLLLVVYTVLFVYYTALAHRDANRGDVARTVEHLFFSGVFFAVVFRAVP